MLQRRVWYLAAYALVLFGPGLPNNSHTQASANATLGGTPCHVFSDDKPTPICQSQALDGHPPRTVVGTDCTTEDVPNNNRGTREYFDIRDDGGMRLFAGVRDEGVHAGPSKKTVRTMKWVPGPTCSEPPPCHGQTSVCEASGITTLVIDPPHKKRQSADGSAFLAFTVQRGLDGCNGSGGFSEFQNNQQSVSWSRTFDPISGTVVDNASQTTTANGFTSTITLADASPEFSIAPDGKTLASSNGSSVNPDNTTKFQRDAHLILTIDGSIGLLHAVNTKKTTATAKIVATVDSMNLEDTNDPP